MKKPIRRLSKETIEKKKQTNQKIKEKEQEAKNKLVKQIQEASKDQLLPDLKTQMEETTNLIVKMLKDKGEDVKNIQIMSLIAKRSMLSVAIGGNVSYSSQEILAAFNLYLEMINKINEIKTFPPTIESFTTFMGISRTTYNNWLVDPDKKSTMDFIHSYLLGILATGGLTGELREITSMFISKTMGKVEQNQPIQIKHEINTNIDDIQERLNQLKKDKIIEADFIESDQEKER